MGDRVIDELSAGNRVERWRDEALGAELLRAAGAPPPLPAHHHPTWQVGQVIEGSLTFELPTWTVDVVPGELVVVPPRVPHAIAPRSATAAYEQVEFPEDFLSADGAAPFRCRSRAALEAFSLVVQRSARGDVASSRLLAASDLRDALFSISEGSAEPEVAVDREAANRVSEMEAVQTFLESTTDRALTVAEVATFAAMPRATLLRRFGEHFHTSPSRYHLSVRVHAACRLMDDGASVGEAAVQTGFSDQSHLTRRARLVLAMGPARWKKRPRV